MLLRFRLSRRPTATSSAVRAQTRRKRRSYHAAFLACATRPEGLPVAELGAALADNPLVVAGVQLFTMRGRRRTRGLALSALACDTRRRTLGGGGAALAGFSLAMALFALGETMVAPSLQPLVNKLASDELRSDRSTTSIRRPHRSRKAKNRSAT